MLVAEVADVGNGAQILTYQLSQDACTCAMQNAHATHAYEDRIIEEMHHGVEGLVASHTSYVEVLMEVLAMVLHRGACNLGGLHSQVCVLHRCGLGCLRWVGIFQLLKLHLGLYVAKDDGGLLAIDALNLADSVETLDADGGTHLYWRSEE